ncbi:hypothetical protein BD560DRAFT_494647 [Blakeslea trispora]|nr:hypothetical protein BD560DRAFT_494647 [Blakeslea trispora]
MSGFWALSHIKKRRERENSIDKQKKPNPRFKTAIYYRLRVKYKSSLHLVERRQNTTVNVLMLSNVALNGSRFVFYKKKRSDTDISQLAFRVVLSNQLVLLLYMMLESVLTSSASTVVVNKLQPQHRLLNNLFCISVKAKSQSIQSSLLLMTRTKPLLHFFAFL